MRVLLHVCCGPCSLMPVRLLREEGHEVTGYFANPNIHPVSEYLRRRETMEEAAARLELPVIWQDDVYSLEGWLAFVHEQGLADNRDGARCRYCWTARLLLTAAVAAERGFEAFCTSLLYSRYQRNDIIAEEGEAAAARLRRNSGPEDASPVFLRRDFRPAWQEGVDLAKAWGLYRQPYCGCVFSEAERYAKKLRRLREQAPSVSGGHP